MTLKISSAELTDADILAIEQSFLTAANQGYAVDDVSCNPEFRIVERVTAKVVSTTSSNRRRELEDSSDRQLQDISDAPSTAPSTEPSMSPTIAILGDTVLNLYVSGVCNNCGNDLFLGDQVDARRRLGLERQLQASVSSSNCYCPLGSLIQTAPPPPERVQNWFVSGLEERAVPVEEVVDLLEFEVPPPDQTGSAGSDENEPVFQECQQYEDCGIQTGKSCSGDGQPLHILSPLRFRESDLYLF
jgi:hypothetical protein